MTSKLVVNTIESDTGISSVSFASSISMSSTSKFHFSNAGIDIGADTNINRPEAGVLGFNINGGEKVRINSSGRMGLGTDSPDTTLTVQSGGDAQMSLKNPSGTTKAYVGTSGAFGSAGTDDLRIRSDSSNIVFGFSGAERVRITSGGQFLIGTTTAVRALTIKDPGQIHVESTSTGNWVGMSIKGSSGTNNYNAYFGMLDSNGNFFIDNGSNGNDFVITQSGQITKPNQPFFKAQPNGSYNITSGNGVVNYQSEIHDVGGIYNASTSTFTAPVGGKYLITWNYFCIPTDKFARANLYKSTNGGSSFSFLHRGDRVGRSGDVYESTTNIAMVWLNANDQLRVQYEEGDLHVNTGYNYFQGYLLG